MSAIIRCRQPDGVKSFVGVVGQRKYYRPAASEEYRYALAPVFSVVPALLAEFVATVRIKIRLTDTNGDVLTRRKGVSRRKDLCKDWWNDAWLNRICAVCQYLSEDGKISIGSDPKRRIVINASPVQVVAAEGINEDSLEKLSFDRKALEEFMNRNAASDEDETADGDLDEPGS